MEGLGRVIGIYDRKFNSSQVVATVGSALLSAVRFLPSPQVFKMVVVVQLVRMAVCGIAGHGFEPRQPPQKMEA